MYQYLFFLLIQLLNELQPFLIECSNICLIFFLLFFIPRSKNFLSIKVFYYIYPGPIFNFFNHKTSSDKFEEQTFAKTFLDFDILTWLPTLKLGSSPLFSLPKPIYVLDILSASYILIVLWYILLYLLTISPDFWICTFFWYWSHVVLHSFVKVLLNFSLIISFSALYIEYVFLSLSCNHDFTNLL